MNVLYISAFNSGYKHLSDLTFPTVESFCSKNGFSAIRFEIPDHFDRPSSWFKIKKLIDLINDDSGSSQFDYFAWIDCDAAILNAEFDVSIFLQNGFDFFIAKDFNNFNCGSFFIRNCNESLVLLQEIYNRTEYLNHIWWEQAAFIDLYESNFRNLQSRTKIVDQSILNSYDYNFYGRDLNFSGSVSKESFIFHCPSLPLKTREDLLIYYINKYGKFV